MSNSGSGNQGICATNPVAVYALENENTEEELIRALMLSHLTAIYIKQSLGKLSALCGCVVASIGSSCGITYLMGGDYQRICNSVKNMVANLTGMICDGAKPSCSLKISSGVSTALLSSLLAMEGRCVTSAEGIVDDDGLHMGYLRLQGHVVPPCRHHSETCQQDKESQKKSVHCSGIIEVLL